MIFIIFSLHGTFEDCGYSRFVLSPRIVSTFLNQDFDRNCLLLSLWYKSWFSHADQCASLPWHLTQPWCSKPGFPRPSLPEPSVPQRLLVSPFSLTFLLDPWFPCCFTTTLIEPKLNHSIFSFWESFKNIFKLPLTSATLFVPYVNLKILFLQSYCIYFLAYL